MPEANTSTTVKVFRPPTAESYMPEKGSALENLSKMQRGEEADERNLNDVRKHTHDGANSKRIDSANLTGFFRVQDSVPAWVPTNLMEQIVIYINGATKRLYVYDQINAVWRYTSLT